MFVLWVCDKWLHLRPGAMARITMKSVSQMKKSNKFTQIKKAKQFSSFKHSLYKILSASASLAEQLLKPFVVCQLPLVVSRQTSAVVYLVHTTAEWSPSSSIDRITGSFCRILHRWKPFHREFRLFSRTAWRFGVSLSLEGVSHHAALKKRPRSPPLAHTDYWFIKFKCALLIRQVWHLLPPNCRSFCRLVDEVKVSQRDLVRNVTAVDPSHDHQIRLTL